MVQRRRHPKTHPLKGLPCFLVTQHAVPLSRRYADLTFHIDELVLRVESTGRRVRLDEVHPRETSLRGVCCVSLGSVLAFRDAAHV
jgi:hypothetical protein